MSIRSIGLHESATYACTYVCAFCVYVCMREREEEFCTSVCVTCLALDVLVLLVDLHLVIFLLLVGQYA